MTTREPKRIQRRRGKGWRMPEGAVYVGRPTRWANPFAVRKHPECFEVVDVGGWVDTVGRTFPGAREARAYAVELYRLHTGPMGSYELDVAEVRLALAGRDLACWCSLPGEGEPDVCHAAVLLEIANEGDTDA